MLSGVKRRNCFNLPSGNRNFILIVAFYGPSKPAIMVCLFFGNQASFYIDRWNLILHFNNQYPEITCMKWKTSHWTVKAEIPNENKHTGGNLLKGHRLSFSFTAVQRGFSLRLSYARNTCVAYFAAYSILSLVFCHFIACHSSYYVIQYIVHCNSDHLYFHIKNFNSQLESSDDERWQEVVKL